MAMQMTRAELRETRRELAQLKKGWEKFTEVASRTGKAAARGFGKNFKKIAVFTLTEFARGALPAIGQRWVESWGQKGTAGGRRYGKRFKRAAKQELESTSGGGGVAGGLTLNLGALKIIGAGALGAMVVGQVKSSLKSAFEQERLELSFDALSTDGAGGARIFEALRTQALRTGVEIEGMASSIQRFMALGFAESDAMELNKSLLDIAGSLGMTQTEAELLGSALAQVKAKGVASMEELRQQIAEKGVPVFQVLADKLKRDEDEIIAMVSRGEIGADTVIEAFQNLEGPLERFRGGADRMGMTAGGLFARLKQEALDLKREFGEELIPELKPLLQDGIDWVRSMKDEAAAFGDKMAEVMGRIRAMFRALSLPEVLSYAALNFQKLLVDALDLAARGAAALMETLKDDSFSRMMERAALNFKLVMYSVLEEAMGTLRSTVGESSQMGKRLGNAEHNAHWLAETARAEMEAQDAEGRNRPGALETFMEKFKEQGRILELGAWEQQKLLDYRNRINRQRMEDLGDRVEPDRAPAGSGSRKAPEQKPGGMDGIVAGGLANALSRIGGGPATIIMDQQLSTQKKIQSAAEKTAAAAVKIAQNTNPRRNRRLGGEVFT